MDLKAKKKELKELAALSKKLHDQAHKAEQAWLALQDEIMDEERAIRNARWVAMSEKQQEAEMDRIMKALDRFAEKLTFPEEEDDLGLHND